MRTIFLCLWLGGCAAPVRNEPEPAAPAVADPVESTSTVGAPGLGDELFPGAGNGGYDVQAYDLESALEKTDGPIDASATIHATSTQALSRFDLDLHGLDVRAIEVDGRSAGFAREGDELVITPEHPIANRSEFTVSVRYGGTPEGIVEPSFPFRMKIGWIAKNGEVYVLSEPTGAKSFFPCNDHPRDKALYTIRVTVPKPLVVVSNGRRAEITDRDNKRTFVYRPRDPMATYLVTIAIGNFVESEIPGPGGLSIHNYFSPTTSPAARRSFEPAGTVLQFLADTFGPYPFESCGNILSSLDLPGALETQTLPTFGIGAAEEEILCHEQAHQWFGNSVSVESWQDIWLNEGFAEYASWMYLEASEGADAFSKRVRDGYAFYRSITKSRDRGGQDEWTRGDAPEPRWAPPGRPTSRSLFGPGVYVRGPLALHALRVQVGDATFLSLLRSWVENHRNGNASVADFLQHVEHGSTPEARATVEHWIFDDEMPHIQAWDERLSTTEKKGEAGK